MKQLNCQIFSNINTLLKCSLCWFIDLCGTLKFDPFISAYINEATPNTLTSCPEAWCSITRSLLLLSKGLPQIDRPVFAGTWPLGGNALPAGGIRPDAGPPRCPLRRFPLMYSRRAD